MIVEHRRYLPLAAVVAVVALGAHRVIGRQALLWGAVAAVACGVLTARRNHDYRSHLALWSKTVEQRPENPRARQGPAEANAELGRLNEAIEKHNAAVRLRADESTYHENLALVLVRANRLDEAILHYRHGLRLVPTEAKTHNNLAIALGRAGRGAAALPHYAEAERLKPTDPPFAYNHGVALVRLGRGDEAIARAEATLRLRPDYADAHFNRAAARRARPTTPIPTTNSARPSSTALA